MSTARRSVLIGRSGALRCEAAPTLPGLPGEGLPHRREYSLIRLESDPPLLRHHALAHPDGELPALAFDQLRLKPPSPA